MAGWTDLEDFQAFRDVKRVADQHRIMEEQELDRQKILKRFRHLHRFRQSFGRKMTIALSGQQRWYECLMKEKDDCLKALNLATAKVYQTQEEQCSIILEQLISEFDQHVVEIKKAKSDIETLELEIKEVDTKIKNTRIRKGEVKAKDGSWHATPSLSSLRNHERAAHQYGIQLAKNRQLGATVHHLQVEHAQLAKSHRNLEKELHRLSADLAEYINVATETYNKKDSSKRAIVKLTEMIDRTKTAFDTEMQGIDINIDFLKRLENFMVAKNKPRENEWLEMKLKLKGQSTAAEKENIFYESALAKIRSKLGEENMEIIIRTFVELAEENYMLFKNISETREGAQAIQVEIDELMDKIRVLNNDIDEHAEEALASQKELQEKIDTCSHLSEEKEAFIAKGDGLLGEYIEGVVTLLSNLGYTTSDIEKLTGTFHRVEERNVLFLMSEIEKYVNKLAEIENYVEYKKWDWQRRNTITPSPVVPLPPRLCIVHRLNVMPPEDKGDEDQVTEASRRPLSRLEIMEVVDRHLENRPHGEDDSDYLTDPIMADPTTEAIGDTPKQKGVVGKSVDIF